MLTAINKQTKRKVHASAVFKDSSYIKPDEDIWYVDPKKISNYEEVLKRENIQYIECRFKKGHFRRISTASLEEDITSVTPHFFIPKREARGIQIIPESEEHKKIKIFIFEQILYNNDFYFIYSKYKSKSENKIINNKLFFKDIQEKINWKNYNECSEDLFEISISDIYNTKRVDILIPFKEKDLELGYGLIIEVQLSTQSNEIKEQRTRDRILKGYSVVWIDKYDFINYNSNKLILKNNPIIKGYLQELHRLNSVLPNEINSNIQTHSRILDEKISESKKIYNQIFLNLQKYKISFEKYFNLKKEQFNENMAEKFLTLSELVVIKEGILCPKCKVGQLVKKKSRNGNYFLGCTEYQNSGCNAIYQVKEK